MKALSVHPYYAMMLVTGEKTIEVRTWKTDYRGDIVICSTSKKLHGMIPGHALGIVELVDVVPLEKKHLKAALMTDKEYEKGLFAWIVKNPRIIKPVPVKGKLSLWTYDGEIEVLPEPKTEEEDEMLFNIYWKKLIV